MMALCTSNQPIENFEKQALKI